VLATSARTTTRRLGAASAFAALALGLLAGPLALPAAAQGMVSNYVADATLGLDGALRVTERITFTGEPPPTLTQKFETREDLIGERQYVLTLSDITATVKGASVDPSPRTDGRFTTITMPTNGANEIEIAYTVTGAVVNTESGTALRYRLLQGLSAQVDEFAATVQIPTQFSYIKCVAGSPNSTVPCMFAAAGQEGAQVPTFRDGPRGEGEVVAVDIGFPAGALPANEEVYYRWTVGRAFSAKPLPLGIALGLLALGGLALYFMHRRTGVDASASGEIRRAGEFVATGPGETEFRVVEDIRPGHVGTVADERVDPIDITASVVDLAVRGHLRITELPRESEFARTDWELTRISGGDDLRPFEKELLDAIAPERGSVKVSEMASRVQDSIGTVQDKLYDDMVGNGWYERRPDAIRNRWTQLALGALIIAVVVTGVLAAFTTFGLVGLALIVLALGLVFFAQEMPSRTPQGAALLGGLGALRSDLLSHPTNQMPKGAEFREVSELLPYAIVLGGADRWLDAIVASDTDEHADSTDLPWYHGPPNWHLHDFPDSLRNFVTTLSGSLFSR
jgi:Predicted membrane protein (DUF2207)